jgi:hypothetical protein
MPGAKGKALTETRRQIPLQRWRRSRSTEQRPLTLGRLQPGRSDNPGGLSKFYQDGRRIARDASPAVMRELVSLTSPLRTSCEVGVCCRSLTEPGCDRSTTSGKWGAVIRPRKGHRCLWPARWLARKLPEIFAVIFAVIEDFDPRLKVSAPADHRCGYRVLR